MVLNVVGSSPTSHPFPSLPDPWFDFLIKLGIHLFYHNREDNLHLFLPFVLLIVTLPPMNYVAHYGSPLGDITLSCDGEAITGLWFDGQKHYMSLLSEPWEDIGRLGIEQPHLPVLDEACLWLDAYFSGAKPDSEPLLRPVETPFRRRVWQVLRTIPYGQTMTYGQIARLLGIRSAQAVGGAVGRNPISLMIPCHRVIGVDGKLTGYDAGLERKLWLLRLEGTALRNGE